MSDDHGDAHKQKLQALETVTACHSEAHRTVTGTYKAPCSVLPQVPLFKHIPTAQVLGSFVPSCRHLFGSTVFARSFSTMRTLGDAALSTRTIATESRAGKPEKFAAPRKCYIASCAVESTGCVSWRARAAVHTLGLGESSMVTGRVQSADFSMGIC